MQKRSTKSSLAGKGIQTAGPWWTDDSEKKRSPWAIMAFPLNRRGTRIDPGVNLREQVKIPVLYSFKRRVFSHEFGENHRDHKKDTVGHKT